MLKIGVEPVENELLSLLDRVRQGDETAFASLLVDYDRIADSAVKRFAPSFDINDSESNGIYSREDLRQYAIIALYRAAETYNPSSPEKGKHVSFGLYAKICVNNAMISALRKYRGEIKKREAVKASERTRRAANDPLDYILSSEDANELTKRISDALTDYEKQVYNYYIIGKSAHEIAASIQREEKSVSNALYRIKVKVRGLLKNQ